MLRTAALICIRNEADRLGWWIAHHVAAGFTALLVCDDHSSDGSRDILAQAASNYDIRLLETDLRETDRLQRRQDALARMVRQEGAGFDWIIQLAVDEYFLPAGRDVAAFLAGMREQMGDEPFRQAARLPVNWCMTGLGRLGQQRLSGQLPHPRALFLTHAETAFPEHRITRDFFRPGPDVPLPDPFARGESPPDWRHGRILHDAAASSQSPQARRHFDRNDHSFPAGQTLLPQALDVSAHILQGLILAGCYAIQNRQDNPAIHTADTTGAAPSFRQFHLHQDNRLLALEAHNRRIAFHPADTVQADAELTPLRLIRMEGSNHGWLYAEAPAGLPFLPACPPSGTFFPGLLDCLPLHVAEHEGRASLTLLPMGVPCPVDGQVCTLEAISTPDADDILAALAHFTAHGFTAAGLGRVIHSTNRLMPSVIGALYAQLPAEEARTLFTPFLHRLFHGWRR